MWGVDHQCGVWNTCIYIKVWIVSVEYLYRYAGLLRHGHPCTRVGGGGGRAPIRKPRDGLSDVTLSPATAGQYFKVCEWDWCEVFKDRMETGIKQLCVQDDDSLDGPQTATPLS